MQEEWKPVFGFEQRYSVSSLGRMYSNTRNRLMSPTVATNGYLVSNLHNEDHTRKRMYVLRMVAIAFLPNPTNLLDIHHKDEVRHNPTVANLEWCTHDYNLAYSGPGWKWSFISPTGSIIVTHNLSEFCRDNAFQLTRSRCYEIYSQSTGVEIRETVKTHEENGRVVERVGRIQLRFFKLTPKTKTDDVTQIRFICEPDEAFALAQMIGQVATSSSPCKEKLAPHKFVGGADVGETVTTLAVEKWERGGKSGYSLTVEGPTIEKVHKFIEDNGSQRVGKHHEIYLSDLRRTSPEKWKIVIRQPMS